MDEMDDMSRGRLLVVDDDPRLKDTLCGILSLDGFEAEGFASGADALRALGEREFDVLVTDLAMPDMDGIALFSAAREIDPDLVGIIMTGKGTMQSAVEAMRAGMFDYLLKPLDMSTVHLVLTRAVQVRRLRRENVRLREDLTARSRAEEDARQQLALITLLNRITRSIAERQDTESIVRIATEQVERSLAGSAVVVLLRPPDADCFSIRFMSSAGVALLRAMGLSESERLSPSDLALPALLRSGIFYFPDLGRPGSRIIDMFRRAGIRSRVVVPLFSAEQVTGLFVAVRPEVDGFSVREREFLKTLADHLSLAMYHAKLYRDLEYSYHELRRTRLEVLQQERLRALGQMAAGIVHDINNALTPITGYVDLLYLTGMVGEGRMKEYIDIIKVAAADIADIVKRIKTFSRRRDESEPLAPVNLSELLQQVVDLTRPRWKDMPQQHGVVIDVKRCIAADIPPVMGIESELREAAVNLVLNALDAMPEGGTLTVKAFGTGAPIEPRCPGSDTNLLPQVVVEIADTGEGMDDETLEHCLEPFYTTKGEKGTGMGLAMVYGIMERHGGEILIESGRGRGTVVRLTFPAAAEAHCASAGGLRVRCPSLKILCIDDDPLVRVFLRRALETESHRVVLADGGKAGLECFFDALSTDAPFDVVVTDLGMPRLDGRQVAREVKRRSPGTPVILLSGWAEQLGEDEGALENIDAVLTKPSKIKELMNALAEVTQVRA